MHELPELVQLVKMVKVAETVKLDNRHKVAKLIQLAKMVKWAETAHVEDLQKVADSDQLVIIVRLARTVHLHKVAACRNGQITRNDQISYSFSRRSAQSSFIGSTGYKSQVSSPNSCEQNAQGNLP